MPWTICCAFSSTCGFGSSQSAICGDMPWPPTVFDTPGINYPILAPTNMATVSDTLGFKSTRQAAKWQVYQIRLVFYPILAPQNGKCIRYSWILIPSSCHNMAGVSDTPGFESHLQAPKWQVYQIHLLFYPILAPQNGNCIRYIRFQVPSLGPKVAGVSDTPAFLSHFGIPKWQVYQIHLDFIPILRPKWQVYQIHLVFYPILAPQNGNCIRYTWFLIPSSGRKLAGVSDTPAFLSHFGTPKWQLYQIHLVFNPILRSQNGRCIRYTWFSIPFWHPKMASVSDTLGF